MLGPKGGFTWKAAPAWLPSARSAGGVLLRTRTLLAIAITGSVMLLWQSVSSSAADMQRYGGKYSIRVGATN